MQTRRETLKQSAIVAGLLASTGLFPQYAFAAFNKAAFDAKTVADAAQGVGRRRTGRKQGRHDQWPGHCRKRRRGAA
jgi:hypothetical protein